MIGELHEELQEALKAMLDDKVGHHLHWMVMSNIEWEARKLLDTSLEMGKIRETQGRVLALQELWDALLHDAGVIERAQEKEESGG